MLLKCCRLIILVVICASAVGLAAEKPKTEPKADASADKGKTTGPENSASAKRSIGYVQSWIPFPQLKLQNLKDRSPVVLEAKADTILAVVFVASWCIPCQKFANIFKTITEKFGDRNVQIVFVFTYDRQDDAKAFAAQYGFAENNSYLATHDVLAAFNQPELPSIYASDRRTWLTFMNAGSDEKLFKEFEQYLNLNTAF